MSSISPDIFPIKVIQDDKKELDRQTKSSILEDEARKRSHWLEGTGVRNDKTPPRYRRGRGGAANETAKFPWTCMKKNSAIASM